MCHTLQIFLLQSVNCRISLCYILIYTVTNLILPWPALNLQHLLYQHTCHTYVRRATTCRQSLLVNEEQILQFLDHKLLSFLTASNLCLQPTGKISSQTKYQNITCMSDYIKQKSLHKSATMSS